MIPEILIKKIIDSCLSGVREDFRKNPNPDRTLLYSIFGDDKYDKFSFFNQAKELLITRGVQDKRTVETRLAFDKDRVSLPTFHITVTGSDPVDNSVGFDPEIEKADTGEVYLSYARRYRKRLSIIITSENSFEVILLSTFLQSMLISLADLFDVMDLSNMSFSEKDMNLMNQQTPQGVFVRSVDISFDYEVRVKIGQDIVYGINKLVINDNLTIK